MYADCSSAFQGNDLHLSTLTDHLSWFVFTSASQSLKRQMKKGLWGVTLWSSRSLLARCAVIRGCFNVVWWEQLASETVLNLCIVITAWEQYLKLLTFNTQRSYTHVYTHSLLLIREVRVSRAAANEQLVYNVILMRQEHRSKLKFLSSTHIHIHAHTHAPLINVDYDNAFIAWN